MPKLTHSYTFALLEYAKEKGLDDIYRHALAVVGAQEKVKIAGIPGPLGEFLQLVPEEEVEEVLRMFLRIARGSMDLLQVEVYSAVPLTQEQLVKLEIKLIKMIKKQMELTVTVDPSLLGGLRVIVDNTVLDDTLKRKLHDMKQKVYRRVYMGQ